MNQHPKNKNYHIINPKSLKSKQSMITELKQLGLVNNNNYRHTLPPRNNKWKHKQNQVSNKKNKNKNNTNHKKYKKDNIKDYNTHKPIQKLKINTNSNHKCNELTQFTKLHKVNHLLFCFASKT